VNPGRITNARKLIASGRPVRFVPSTIIILYAATRVLATVTVGKTHGRAGFVYRPVFRSNFRLTDQQPAAPSSHDRDEQGPFSEFVGCKNYATTDFRRDYPNVRSRSRVFVHVDNSISLFREVLTKRTNPYQHTICVEKRSL